MDALIVVQAPQTKESRLPFQFDVYIHEQSAKDCDFEIKLASFFRLRVEKDTCNFYLYCSFSSGPILASL